MRKLTMKQMASETGIEFIDVNTPLKNRQDVIGEDHVYPTPTGHAALAESLVPAVKALLERSSLGETAR